MRLPLPSRRRAWQATLAAAVVAALGACQGQGSNLDRESEVPGGNASRGPDLMRDYGCTTCHTVPGVTGADGKVGPPLTDFAHRSFIAGRLSNEAENLVLWIMNPQRVDPGNAMPTIGVTEEDARDIAAYLYTLD